MSVAYTPAAIVPSGYYVKALAFSLSLSVPLMCPVGVRLGTYWLCPVLFFVVLPLAGRLIGTDRTAYYPALPVARPWEIYFAWLPYAYLPLWLAAFCWSAATLSRNELDGLAMVGISVSLAIASGVSTCVTHEIMHRSGRFDQAFARGMIALCGYGHLMLEHSAHHAHVGDLVAGGTPRRGENAYAFVWRDTWQGLHHALRIEQRRLQSAGLACWHNHIAQNYALAALLLSGFGWRWGAAAGTLFVFQAAFTLFAVQMITYIQHYGLARHPGEPVLAHHAWADNCPIANALTLNNNHHSHHHLQPRTPYYHLRGQRHAPRLPASYMVMFVLALVPPLWRRVMDPRLARYELRWARHHAVPHPG